jgi:hypothetical protein
MAERLLWPTPEHVRVGNELPNFGTTKLNSSSKVAV